MNPRKRLAVCLASLLPLIAVPAFAEAESPSPTASAVAPVAATPAVPAAPPVAAPDAVPGPEGARRDSESDKGDFDPTLAPEILAKLTPEEVKEVLLRCRTRRALESFNAETPRFSTGG